MLVIAENLNVRNAAYMEALKKKDRKAHRGHGEGPGFERGRYDQHPVLARRQRGRGRAAPGDRGRAAGGRRAALPGFEEREGAQEGHPFCTEPPLINYLSADEKNADEILGLVKEAKSSLILRALKGTVPATLEAKLMILEDLIEKANAADIPNERIFADPSLVHIARGMGQESLLNAHEAIIVLNEMVDPPLNTVVWISNATTGLPKKLKSRVASALLCYLAGRGSPRRSWT